MEIAEMSSNEAIKEFLESRINSEIEGKVLLWGHKGLLDIDGRWLALFNQ